MKNINQEQATVPSDILERNDFENTIDTQLENLVVDLLMEKGWHISFAESCTGGLAAGRLVNVPNASSVLDASLVTYANEAKIFYLDVSPNTIAEHGVVSEQVVREMAMGVALKNHAQVGVGISGIAGPGGATAQKPIGMVCFGFYLDGKIETCTQYFGDIGRNVVRKNSVDFVYEKLLELLKNA